MLKVNYSKWKFTKYFIENFQNCLFNEENNKNISNAKIHHEQQVFETFRNFNPRRNSSDNVVHPHEESKAEEKYF